MFLPARPHRFPDPRRRQPLPCSAADFAIWIFDLPWLLTSLFAQSPSGSESFCCVRASCTRLVGHPAKDLQGRSLMQGSQADTSRRKTKSPFCLECESLKGAAEQLGDARPRCKGHPPFLCSCRPLLSGRGRDSVSKARRPFAGGCRGTSAGRESQDVSASSQVLPQLRLFS